MVKHSLGITMKSDSHPYLVRNHHGQPLDIFGHCAHYQTHVLQMFFLVKPK